MVSKKLKQLKTQTDSFYLAARYARMKEMQGYADKLLAHDLYVTSHWIWGDEGDDLRTGAVIDFQDVQRANNILAFSDPHGSKQGGGGRHTELGIAMALGKTVYLIGPREQIFHHHPSIKPYSDFDSFLSYIATTGATRNQARSGQGQVGPVTLGSSGGSSKGHDLRGSEVRGPQLAEGNGVASAAKGLDQPSPVVVAR